MNAFDNSPEGRDWVLSMLRENVISVAFTKKNGEERIMQCTLNPKHFAQDKYRSDLTEDTKLDRTNCTVWDINAQGWRSFIWTNIKHIDITL